MRFSSLALRVRLLVTLVTSAACSKVGEPVDTRRAAPPPSASAAATVAASAASPAPPDAGPPSDALNVILLTVDSLRADMPWTGYGRPIAPRMSAFAETAVVYERFYAISSYTAMSVGGMLSGRYPSELDRNAYYFAGYPESVLFFPDLLRKAGVKTLSAQAHFYFDQRAGFRKAFDVYEMVPGIGEDHQTDGNVTSPAHLALAKKVLSDKASTEGRFFAWFHFLDPHDKYQAHADIDYGRSTRDLYDGEVTFTDRHIGDLLDFVDKEPWGKRTAIVISADHGEAFGEHPFCFRHGFELWDVLTHVPLMIRAPGVAPRRIATPRSAIDLAPTILDLFGVEKDPRMEGTSLVPELRGKEPEARDVILDLPRTSDSDRRRALIRGDYKLIALGDDDAFQLFDLKSDPAEARDARWAHPEAFEEMKAAYAAWGARIPSICPLPTANIKLRGKKRYKPC
jgi:choline-sulfatase